MTEHAVVNVHGEDRQKIKGGVGVYNGGSHAVVNGAHVGGKIHADVTFDSVSGSDAVSAAADGGSAASDPVAVVDDNGDGGSGAEGLEVGDAESHVTVLEVTVSEIINKESVGTDSSAVSKVIAKEEIREKEISSGTVSVDGENANLGSVTHLDVSGDMDVAEVVVVDEGVIDVNKNHDNDHGIENSVAGTDVVVDRGLNEQAVENEINGGDANGGTTITDSNGAVDAQNSVEDEIHGDGITTVTVANGPVDVKNGVEDVIHSDGVTTVTVANGPVDVQNGVKDEIHGDADGVCITDANGEVGIHSSSVENKIHGDSNKDTITDVNVEVSVQNSVENEIHDDVNGVDVAGAAEVLGEKDIVTVFVGVAHENKSHGEVESVALENGMGVESDVPVVVDGVSVTYVEECADNSDRTSSGEKTQIESLYSRGGDEKDGGTFVQEKSKTVSDTNVDKSLEYKNIDSTDVSNEKDIVTNKSQDGELESVADIRNCEDTSLNECTEKNVVSVDVDGVSPTTDVKDEFHQNGLEKAKLKSVTEVDVERSVVGAEVQNGLAEPELSDCTKEKEVPIELQVGSKPENFEETILEPVLGEKFSAINTTHMTIDSNVVSDLNGNELDCKAEPSADISDIKNIAADIKAEPENNVVKSEMEPSLQGDISTEGGNRGEGDSRPTQEGSSIADSFDGHNVGSEVVKRPFYYLIRLPRYDDDENIQEQINNALKQVDEKTEHRGKIRAEINNRKDLCNEYRQDYRAAKSAEKTARDLFKSKRQELDSVKSTMNRLNNTISVGDIDNKEKSKTVSDTNVDKSLEYKNIDSTDVSNEKDIVTNKSQDGELESVADIRNCEDTSLNECTEKNVVSVDVDGVSPTTDVKDEFHQNGLEKAKLKSVTEVDVERSVVGAEVQNGLAEPELSDCTKEKEVPIELQVGSKPENFEETILEPVLGEKFSAINTTHMTIDSNVVSDLNGNELDCKAEPSADISDIKNIAADIKAEPENNVVKSEMEPSLQGDISTEGGNRGEGDSRPTQEGSSIADSFDGHNVGSEVVKRPFYYLIRLPRYDDDENIQEQINNALKQVDEKTEHRGKIRAEINNRKDLCNEYRQDYRAAKSAEKTARDLFKSKRQELDSVKSTMNRLNNTISVGDIDNKIRNMEHMIQHETLPLNEEKQLIRQIKQLKQNRGELSSIIGKQDQSQQSTDQNDNIEEHTKRSVHLKKELDLLRNNLQKAETATKAAQKKYDDEWDKLSELQGRFNLADRIRQEAYTNLRSLKSQLHEKKKYFWEYKGAITKGQELAAEGRKDELQSFCIDQVERIMELWNKSDEFRRDYIRCNTRSTVRRLQTLDGRALGPGEQPPVILNATITERVSKNNSQIKHLTLEQETKSTSIESVDIKDESVSKVVIQKTERNQTTKGIKPAKPAPSEKSSVAVLRWGDEPNEPEDSIEEPVRTKEEEELILKAEKTRKEDEAAKLKEKRRLEEIEKAKEAMERKKRNAEKAQQRAILKAQKEAEQKEKEREKKARKKERRKAATTDNAENTEQEPAPTSESLTITEEIDQSEKPVEVTKRPQKQPQFPKQTSKSKSVPLPLRNRGKRRIQPWVWWALIAVLFVVALFYMVGNISSLRY
ncbi:hypothetical protein TanjilG_28846 [Lupinus angustifolius]|uniref:Uncharacterized protein n=1 Tax=Lupinus angustifolius TaxID=3871 RepID=A0A4P1R8T9_LUPAN|nr:hypothetical protein TanjilG_28846 [Lupinus angustifolius]